MDYNNIQYDFPEISKNEKFILFDKLKSEETKSMNFEQYRKKVYDELSTIETDIISRRNTIKNSWKCSKTSKKVTKY